MSPRGVGELLPADALERAEFLRQFAGCWIATYGGRVIVAEKSADDLFRKLTEMKIPDARVRRIPEDLDAIHVGMG